MRSGTIDGPTDDPGVQVAAVELKELSLALRRHWVIALLAFGLCFSLGALAAVSSERPYVATAIVAATPVTSPEGGAAPNVVQTANYLLPIYVEELRSRDFRTAVRETLPPEVADVPVTVDPSSDAGTGILRIRVSAPQAVPAAAWATAMADRLASDVDAAVGGPLELRVLERAAVPRTPQSRASTFLLASFVLGLIAAVFAALVASRVVRALDAVEEVRRRLGAPVLGEIPKARSLRSPVKSVGETLVDGPRDVLEAFQALRTNVELALVQHRPDVIAVTSFASGEGKSTVAAALGLSMAAVGHSVTLIDADLRQPSLHHRLGEPFGDGLADVTTADPHHLVRSLPSGVDFLAAGVPDRHPADVMAVALPHALSGLRGEGNLVIVDGPPLQGVAETPYIASLANHVILVLDPAGTKLPEIERAVARLRESGVVVLGVVLNRARRRRRSRTNPYYAYSISGQDHGRKRSRSQPPVKLVGERDRNVV